jgi:Flp pilus assembly pilin Flp
LHHEYRSEEGQAMVEYGLLLALVTLVTVAALTAIGESVVALLEAVAAHLADIAGGL